MNTEYAIGNKTFSHESAGGLSRRDFLKFLGKTAVLLGVGAIPSDVFSPPASAASFVPEGLVPFKDEYTDKEIELKKDLVQSLESGGTNAEALHSQEESIGLSINFLEKKTPFTASQKNEIQKGFIDAFDLWGKAGVQDVAQIRTHAINIREAEYNGANFYNDSAWIDLQTRSKSIAAHEASHIFGIRVQGWSGMYEAPAVLAQMLLYGGSIDNNQKPTIESVKGFVCKGGGFLAEDRKHQVDNYNKAGVAAKEIGLDVWVHLTNRYNDWRRENNLPRGVEVPQATFKGWIEEIETGLFKKMQQKYPILFCPA